MSDETPPQRSPAAQQAWLAALRTWALKHDEGPTRAATEDRETVLRAQYERFLREGGTDD